MSLLKRYQKFYNKRNTDSFIICIGDYENAVSRKKLRFSFVLYCIDLYFYITKTFLLNSWEMSNDMRKSLPYLFMEVPIYLRSFWQWCRSHVLCAWVVWACEKNNNYIFFYYVKEAMRELTPIGLIIPQYKCCTTPPIPSVPR